MNVSVSGWNLCCVCEEVLLNDIYTNEECFDSLELSSLWLVNYVSILMEKTNIRLAVSSQTQKVDDSEEIFIIATLRLAFQLRLRHYQHSFRKKYKFQTFPTPCPTAISLSQHQLSKHSMNYHVSPHLHFSTISTISIPL